MKPSFALDFRDGVIALLHRTTRGWQSVGASPLDAADLGEALTYLRSTALGLAPRGLSTKLVIPNEMILYTQVHAPGPEVAKRRKQIRAALEGLTPYKTEDLVFDWWGNGPQVHVAVVARETLAEAEAFAVEHRFNPVSFVGAPEHGEYRGEPFFGPSALSATLLAEGEKVERDQEPVTGLVREFGKPAAPELAEKPVEAPIDLVVSLDLPVEASVAELPAELAVVEPVAPPVVQAPAPPPQPVAVAAPEPAKPLPPLPPFIQNNPLPDFAAAKAPAKGASSFDPAKLAIDLVDEAPMAVDVADEAPPLAAARAEPPVKQAKASDDLPPGTSGAVIAAFASRRAAAEPVDDKARKQPSLGPAPQQRPSVPRPALAKPVASLPSANRETVPFPTKTATASKFPISKSSKPPGSGLPVPQIKRDKNVVQLPKQAVQSDETAAAVSGKPSGKTETGLDGRPVAPRGKPRFLGLVLTLLLLLALALVAAWSSYFLTANDPDPNAAPPANAVAALTPEVILPASTGPASTAPDSTAPGSTAPDSTAPDSTAPGSTAPGSTAPGSTAPDSTAPDLTVTATADAVPTVEDEAFADGQDPANADPAPTDAALAVAPTSAEAASLYTGMSTATAPADAVTAEPAAQAATAPEAAKPEPAPATLVSTEAAQASAIGTDPQDEIFLADADTPPHTSDPLALPQMVAASDAAPDAYTPPPPFGTLYTFDAQGRIQPTPEGIVTPEGVLLIAGAPKVVPPTRPAALTTAASVAALPLTLTAAAPAPANLGSTAAPADAAAVSALSASAAAQSEPLYADPALAGKRPKSRPTDLVDPASATAKQGEALAPAANSRFASVRPQARPAAMTTPVTQAADLQPDPEVTNAAAAASLALNGVKASTLAVAVSKMPAARPSGMDQAVNAAVAAAVRAPEPQQQAANVAPESQTEPEVETAAPTMPTNASVAKQATTKDAINLSRVALLGIFGTSAGRYAMIRQAAGGVKKVKVGDTIDGGRIAAITANAVQYQKGGRMLSLTLPTL